MINTATLLGRVGKKETKPLKNGGDITVLFIATSKKYKDSSGQAQEQTTWHNVNCFSKLSDIASKYVHVGDLIVIIGEIQNRKIESGERAGQYIYSITANEIKFIPKNTPKPKEQTSSTASPQQEELDYGVPF